MSPASSGPLEVERYIGACLISSQSRPKKNSGIRDHQFGQNSFNNLERYPIQRCNNTNERWAGGVPLISFTNQRWRTNECVQKITDNSPLARLAVHTQGAPLILTNRYNHRKTKVTTNKQKTDCVNKKSDVVCKDTQNVCDAISVTSDESSGSNQSDTCLPRIIKPRKRRKKDRKPPHLQRPLSQDGSFSTDSASPDIIDSPTNIITFMPFVPYGFDAHLFKVPDIIPSINNYTKCDTSETPKLHHSFEDIEDIDDGKDVNGNASSCQCRYCDPSGQIWDIDRSCYSPYLTPEHQRNYDVKINSSTASTTDNSSLMDSMSSLSLEEDLIKSPLSSPRSTNDEYQGRFTTDLEVSTEIVTFLNGHRDLEIKFFSSPSSSSTTTSTTNKVRERTNP